MSGFSFHPIKVEHLVPRREGPVGDGQDEEDDGLGLVSHYPLSINSLSLIPYLTAKLHLHNRSR